MYIRLQSISSDVRCPSNTSAPFVWDIFNLTVIFSPSEYVTGNINDEYNIQIGGVGECFGLCQGCTPFLHQFSQTRKHRCRVPEMESLEAHLCHQLVPQHHEMLLGIIP